MIWVFFLKNQTIQFSFSSNLYFQLKKASKFSIFHYTFFLRNTFSKAGSMLFKISSIWAWNVAQMFPINFGSHHHLQMATYSMDSFVYYYFFQISRKLNLLSCRDGVYSLSMILSVCFDVKKTLGNFSSEGIDFSCICYFFQYANYNFSFKILQY